jgi:hypothetical protein
MFTKITHKSSMSERFVGNGRLRHSGRIEGECRRLVPGDRPYHDMLSVALLTEAPPDTILLQLALKRVSDVGLIALHSAPTLLVGPSRLAAATIRLVFSPIRKKRATISRDTRVTTR